MTAAVRRSFRAIATTVLGLAILGAGALVVWNVFFQARYGETCEFSLGCRSFYCLHHELQGSAQISTGGHCTKSCGADADCGEGKVCVVLTESAADDLPPFGKPDKACMWVRAMPSDMRR